jgi:hypothetical protein
MALDVLLARQAGVVSREQAVRAGLSGAAVDRLVRTRRWCPLYPRVYLVRGHGTRGDEAGVWAALLWAGDGAVLCGAAAAWWLGLLPGPPGTLAVSARVRRPPRPGVAVRCRPLAAADRTEHRGLPVTVPGLSVLEAAVELGAADGGTLLDDVLADDAGWADVLAAHRRHPTAAAGPLLAAAVRRSTEAADTLLVRLLRASALRGWDRRPATASRPAGVVFPAAGLVVEVGGRPGDGRPLPPRLLRVDRRDLVDRPTAVLAAVTAALGRDLHHARGRIGPLCSLRRQGPGSPGLP